MSSNPILLDFGTSTSPLEPNYTRVSLVSYNATQGFGWDTISTMGAYNYGNLPNPLTSDGHLGRDNTFLLDLENGQYNVTAQVGDSYRKGDRLSIFAEDQQVANNITTKPGQFDPVTFQVTINDGKLHLRFYDQGGQNYYFSLTALTVERIDSPPLVANPLVADAGSDQVSDEGTSIQFAGSASGDQAGLTYSWDFGDGYTALGQSPTHTFADDGNYTVNLTVTDSQGINTTDSLNVVVNNVAPMARPGGPYSGMKDNAITFSGSAYDPGMMDTAAGFTYLWNFGDGMTSNQADASHAYGQAGTYTVSLKAMDKDGASTTTTTTVTVDNPSAPVANAGADKFSNEGTSVLFYGTATGGEGALTYSWNFGDGSQASGQTAAHAYADNGIYTAILTVTDSLGQTSSDSVTVTVNNVAPTATLTNGGTVNEANPGTITFSGASDPSLADTNAGFLYSYDFNNDGVFEITNTTDPTATVPASFLADGPSSQVIRGRITDKNGGFTDYTTAINITNVAPTANAGGPYSGVPGTSITFTGNATDPSSVDTTAGFTYLWNFGDGTTSTEKSPTHGYLLPGNYNVTLNVTDKDGASHTATTSATITSSLPVVNAGADKIDSEGSVISFAGSVTGGLPGYTWNWNFGDGTTGSGQSPNHIFADNGIYTVILTLTDSLGQQATDSLTVTINNVAPTASTGGSYAGSTGSAITFNGNATDPSSADTAAGFTYLWNFGDGTTSTLKSPSHTYAQAGTYTITLNATDKDGASHAVSTTAAITAPGTRNTDPFIITHHDKIPNFGQSPTIYTVSSGNWSDVSIWSGNRLPTTADVVSIDSGFTVSYDVSSTDALKTVVIQAGGHLIFRTDISTKLTVQNFLVLENGELQVGTEANPVAPNVKAEIIFADIALDTVNDPSQYGNGLIGLGKVTMHGAVKSDTFVRLAVEPKAGDTTLTLDTPVTGWQVGDRLVLPDSKQWRIASGPYTPEWETLTLAGISADGRVLTLTSPLKYDHPGARNADGVLEFLPHIGNLTRNLVVRSQSATGTRGHVMFTYRADVDIRYSQFSGLGRTTIDPIDNTTYDQSGNVTHVGTNQIARYPVHFHHLMGPKVNPENGYQYTFQGNSVFCPLGDHRFRWGITIHDSHYGLVQDNVLYNWAGAGIVTESGNESFNVIAHNFVVAGRGVGGRQNGGNEGQAFWFRGPNNYIRDNVAANYVGNQIEAAYGYKFYFVYLGDLRVPNFAGADTSKEAEFTLKYGNSMPLLEFSGNEVYGTENGLTIWWLGSWDTRPENVTESVVKDFRAWHFSLYGFYGYPTTNLTFDGLLMRGDASVLSNPNEYPHGLYFSDYMTKNLYVKDSSIQGMRYGIYAPYFAPGDTVIENTYLRNDTNILIVTPGAPGSSPQGATIPSKRTIIRNVKFDSLPGYTLKNIALGYWTQYGSANLVVPDEIYVYDYNQVKGDNFQVYYLQQAPDFIVPQSTGNLVGSPENGLTNQQNWEKYQIAIAGSVSPTTETLDGVVGFVRWF